MAESIQPRTIGPSKDIIKLLCQPRIEPIDKRINPYLAATELLMDQSRPFAGDSYERILLVPYGNQINGRYRYFLRRHTILAQLEPLSDEQSLEVPGSAELIFTRSKLDSYFHHDCVKRVHTTLRGVVGMVASAFILPDFEPQFVPRYEGDGLRHLDRKFQIADAVAEYVFKELHLQDFVIREAEALNEMAQEFLPRTDNS